MPLIDCHTYLMRTPYSDAMSTRDTIRASMQRYELDAVFLVSALGTSCDFVNGNRQLRQVLSAEAGIYGYVTLNVDYPELSQVQQREYLTRREFVGSVLYPRSGTVLHIDDVRDIVNALRRYTKPLALYTPNTEAVHAARQIATEFPTLQFLLLNMGGDGWRSAVDAAKDCVNVHLELSGSLDADKVAYAYSSIAARRLYFGSGLPNADPNVYKTLIEEADVLGRLDKQRIYSQNASLLFHLQSDE